jgi:hypothetical protein
MFTRQVVNLTASSIYELVPLAMCIRKNFCNRQRSTYARLNNGSDEHVMDPLSQISMAKARDPWPEKIEIGRRATPHGDPREFLIPGKSDDSSFPK